MMNKLQYWIELNRVKLFYKTFNIVIGKRCHKNMQNEEERDFTRLMLKVRFGLFNKYDNNSLLKLQKNTCLFKFLV